MIISLNKKVSFFSRLAEICSTQSTCARRQVGCVLVNSHYHIVATGYNGVASGQPHCIDKPCSGAQYISGKGLDQCEAIHAEQNALIQCKNTQEIKFAFCTTFPCIHCIKMLMNTSCQIIYYQEKYSHKKAKKLWVSSGHKAFKAVP